MAKEDMLARLRELMRRSPAGADGYTTLELMSSLGMGQTESAARKFRATVRAALAGGILERCTIVRENIHGHAMHQVGFRFATPPKTRAARKARP